MRTYLSLLSLKLAVPLRTASFEISNHFQAAEQYVFSMEAVAVALCVHSILPGGGLGGQGGVCAAQAIQASAPPQLHLLLTDTSVVICKVGDPKSA